jgi:hypothetical protein
MRVPILSLFAALSASAVSAAGLPDASTCYERTYGARHLAAHPGQKVRRIAASYSVFDGGVQVHLDDWLRGNATHYAMYADCTADGAGKLCKTDFADGGFWRVSATPKGGLLVTNGDVWVNTYASDSQQPLPEGRRLKAKPADRSWALARLTSCPERGGENN